MSVAPTSPFLPSATDTSPAETHESGPISVLIIDDDEFMRATAREVLESQGFITFQAGDGERGLERFIRHRPDVVLLDVQMPGMDGYETCSRIRALPGGEFTPILMTTGLDDLDSIESAYEAGATDFEMKPLQWTVVSQRIGYMLCAARSRKAEVQRQRDEKRRLEGQLRDLKLAVKEARMIYRSRAMENVIRVLRRVAPTDATVLVHGESGTGKELMAQTLHALSERTSSPMVTVDCGAIPPSLIESELFGHEKGAYTGAEGRRVGRLAEADGGTVFLDEIGELPLEVQSKLLRFVQEKHFTPVGATQPRHVDVRVVAATNRDLRHEVEAGRFREDLYFRLNVVHLLVPPLRERPEDILFLARHFLERYAVQYQRSVRSFTAGAEAALLSHDWPGNVRELQNRVLQGVILCESGELGAAQLDLRSLSGPQSLPARSSTREIETSPVSSEGALDESSDPLRALERALERVLDTCEAQEGHPPVGRWLRDELVLIAYEAAQRRLRPAARLCDLPPSTFRRRLKKAEAAMSRDTDRLDGWDAVSFELEHLVEGAGDTSLQLDGAVEARLTEILCRRYPGQTKRGAALAGVSAPTFRKRAREVL